MEGTTEIDEVGKMRGRPELERLVRLCFPAWDQVLPLVQKRRACDPQGRTDYKKGRGASRPTPERGVELSVNFWICSACSTLGKG